MNLDRKTLEYSFSIQVAFAVCGPGNPVGYKSQEFLDLQAPYVQDSGRGWGQNADAKVRD